MKATNSKAKELSVRFVQDLIVPILMIVVSFILIFAVFIPVQRDIANIKKEYVKVKIDADRLQRKYNVITSKSPEELKRILDDLRLVVPDYINIGELGKVVNSVSNKYGLSVNRLSLQQEQLIVGTKDIKKQSGVAITVKTIRGPFRISGDRNTIFDFLDFLVTGPYAIEFDAVRVSGDEETWSAAFSVLLYYLPAVEHIPASAGLVVPNWQLVNEVSDYLENIKKQTDIYILGSGQ